MPMIDLTLPKGRLDRTEQEALAAELTRLIIHWESGTDRPGYDKAAWAFVQEADVIEVGGRPRVPGGRQVYRVVVSVPKGSLDDGRRAGLISDVAHAPLRLRDLAVRFGVAPGDARWDELRFDQR